MTEEALHLLMSSDGQMLLAELASEPIGEAHELRLLTKYRKQHPAKLVTVAFAQIKLRAKGRAKFTRADQMYFTADGLEQASTERMARYHARQFPHATLLDLCCGIGGDLIGLAESHQVVAVDLDPLHLRMAVSNAGAYRLGHNVREHRADVTEMGTVDEGVAAFIDPARRIGGRRLPAGESEPPLAWCLEFGNQIPTMVKASPALSLEVVPPGWGIEFVSEGRELKESLLSSPRMNRHERRATLLGSEPRTLMSVPGDAVSVREPGRFLLDPDAAVTRAGLVEDLARSVGAQEVWKIDREVAFLSSNEEIDTPFGRCLSIQASLPWNLNRLKEALRSLDVGTVDIRKRGSAVDVDAIQRRLKLTGTRSATVVLTRVDDKPWVFVGFSLSG